MKIKFVFSAILVSIFLSASAFSDTDSAQRGPTPDQMTELNAKVPDIAKNVCNRYRGSLAVSEIDPKDCPQLVQNRINDCVAEYKNRPIKDSARWIKDIARCAKDDFHQKYIYKN